MSAALSDIRTSISQRIINKIKSGQVDHIRVVPGEKFALSEDWEAQQVWDSPEREIFVAWGSTAGATVPPYLQPQRRILTCIAGIVEVILDDANTEEAHTHGSALLQAGETISIAGGQMAGFRNAGPQEVTLIMVVEPPFSTT